MRMSQVGGDLDLSEEAFGPDYSRQFRLQDLESHLAIVLQVLGQVDRSHPALAQLSLDGVAAPKSSIESFESIGHGHSGIRPRSTSKSFPVGASRTPESDPYTYKPCQPRRAK